MILKLQQVLQILQIQIYKIIFLFLIDQNINELLVLSMNQQKDIET